MSAREILSLIEAVDPSDTAKMDEIDIRTHCWMRNREWGGWHKEGSSATGSWALDKDGNRIQNSYVNHSSFTRLSRSRDELKAIRPPGWRVFVSESSPGGRWTSRYWRDHGDEETFVAPLLPTEELAELYAIIQASEHHASPMTETKGEL